MSAAAAAPLAFASPQSEELTRKGLAEFEKGRYRAAIAFFNDAVKSDATDLRPVFFQAMSLNRLGSHREAYLLLRGVEAQGLRHPEMDFEFGWSLMGLERGKACVERLERFEAASPGRGQTSEFLGRCHVMTGDLDRAERSFRLAVEREPRLKPGVDLWMASVEQERGRTAEARDRLRSAAQADAPTGRALRDVLGSPQPQAPPVTAGAKPWRAGFSLSAGHNDNVIGLGNTIPLPTDISRKGADFLRLNFGADYTKKIGEQTAATLGYAGVLDRYHGLSASNLDDHFVYGDLFHRLDARTGLSLRVSDEYTLLGGDRFRNQATVRPAVSRRFTEHSTTELAWSYGHGDYYSPVPQVFDRDGYTSVLSATHYLQVQGTAWSGAISASYTQNRAEGNDFTFDGYGAAASVRYDFTTRIAGVVGASYTRYDYSNINSLSPGSARDDDQKLVSAQVTGYFSSSFRWFVQAQRLRNASNIAFYDYKQNVVSAGVGASF